MRVFAVILLLVFFPTTILWAQKGRKKQDKQPETEEVVPFSSRDFPYIENFHKAVHEKISGNHKEALLLFEKCLAERQDDDAVYFAIAEINKEQGNLSEALINYEKAYQIDPQNNVYLEELAYAYFEKSNFEAAEVYFQILCGKNPRDIDYRYGYLRVLIYNKLYAKAIEQADKMEELVGIIPDLSVIKADLYLELKNPQKAEETMLLLKNEYSEDANVLQEVVQFYEQQGKNEEAIAVLEELVEKKPENGVVYYVLAENYIEKGEVEKFVEIAPKVFQFNDIDVEYKLYVFDELLKVKKSNDAEIMEISEKMYFDYPDNDMTALNYSNTLVAQRKSMEALEIFRETLKNNPDNFEAWGSILSFESRYFEFEKLYEDGKEAMSLFPTMPYPYYAASEGALKVGKIDEALEIVATGEIYVLDDKAQKALFNLRRGQILFAQKDHKKGIVAFEKALQQDKSTVVKINYALALIEANIATDVSKELLEEIAEDDKNEKFYRAAALWQLNKNQFSKAIEIAEEGMEKVFNNAELCDLLGDLYFKNENLQKAIETWQKAEKLESRNKILSKKINDKEYYAPKYH